MIGATITPIMAFLSAQRLRQLSSNLVVRNAAMLYLLQLSTYGLPVLLIPYLSHVLSPERIGQIGWAQMFTYYFVILTDYGFALTATRKIAIHCDDPEAVSKIFNNVMAARFLLMTTGFSIMMAVVFSIPKMRAIWPLFPVCYLAVVGNVLFPQWLFQGLQKMQHIVFRDLSAKLLSVVAIFAFVHSDRDYLLAAGLQSAGMVLAGLVSLFMMRRVTGVRFARPDWNGVREEMRGSWTVFLSLAANTTYTSTNTFLLGFVAADAIVANYTNAFKIINALRGLVSPIVTAIYPHISRLASGSSRDAVRFVQRYAFVLTAPFLLVSSVVSLTAPMALRLFFDNRYDYMGTLVQVMAPSVFLFAISHCYSTYFMLAFGYQREWSRLIWKVALLNFVVLLPLMYLISPAMALAITGVVLDLFIAVYSYLFYRKHSAEVLRRPESGPPHNPGKAPLVPASAA